MGRIPRSKVLPESGDDRPVEVINVKIDPARLPELLDRPGYRPAYHMNKRSWVTILLDGTLPDGEITGHIRRSRESV
jgi:predicted DNA-binding protein (MmcQ/YjbR family)